MTRTWIRVQDGVAADAFEQPERMEIVPGVDILVGIGDWVEITDLSPRPASGWRYDGSAFSAPPAPEAPPSEAIVRTLKSDIWRRCTDEEAEALEAALNAAPVRLRRLFNDSTILESNWPEYEALRSGIVQAVGEERAAELLAASQA
ncbi:hypothetical protein [Roseomonas chloroacetimidivorans]|uniref:hypothetical protein n=1 Tax=Roseomonas chloroacetimidivorans TaxID=1766656 RepID=UPI003C723DC2